MSYLAWPRLHFSGLFQADPSTVNNDPTHYDEANFQPSYQKRREGNQPNGWWNPDGSGSFRLVGCRVQRAIRLDGSVCRSAHDDPVVGMWIRDADERVAGKLVDLDPEQQMVSQIWGMIVRLHDPDAGETGTELFRGDYVVAPFADLWQRTPGRGAGTLGCQYQSQLVNVAWGGDLRGSRFLEELRQAAPDGRLSIKFNVDGYNLNWNSASFTLGRLTGTIGPAAPEEPVHFVLGRQLLATPDASGDYSEYFAPAEVNRQRTRVTLDLGNSLPTQTAGGPMTPLGTLDVAIVTPGRTYSLGQVSYQNPEWYTGAAGVQDFPVGRDLTPEEADALDSHPLAVRVLDGGAERVLIQEHATGLYLRADQFVYRMSPGDTADVALYVTRFGKPVEEPDAPRITFDFDTSGLQPTPGLPVGTPTSALRFDRHRPAGAGGRVSLRLTASRPGNPRGYIDGQVYGVRYSLAGLPDASYPYNPSNFISVLVWDEYTYQGEPNWTEHVHPLLQQYADLYPVMLHVLNLGDYDSVVANRKILKLVFSADVGDPNYMPVTRDLSPAKQAMLLRWLNGTGGPDGRPLRTAPETK